MSNNKRKHLDITLFPFMGLYLARRYKEVGLSRLRRRILLNTRMLIDYLLEADKSKVPEKEEQTEKIKKINIE